MGKQWVRQEMRRNELQDAVDSFLVWIADHRQAAGGAAVGLLAAVLGAVLVLHRSKTRQEEAWDRLSMAQAYAYGGRAADSLQQIGELARDYGSTSASGYAQLFAGDLQYRQGSYKEAVATYAKLISEGGDSKILGPLALGGTAAALESSGQAAEAAAAAQRFLDSYPDHFLAPQVHTGLARSLLAAGQGEQAKVTWQKITLQYPDTPWAAQAQARLKQ